MDHRRDGPLEGIERAHLIERIGPVDGLIDGEVLAEDRVERQRVHILDRRRPALQRLHRRARPRGRRVTHEIAPHVGPRLERGGLFLVEILREHLLLELEHPDLKRRVADAPAGEGAERIYKPDPADLGAGQRRLLRLNRGEGSRGVEEQPARRVELPPDEPSGAYRRSQLQERPSGRHLYASSVFVAAVPRRGPPWPPQSSARIVRGRPAAWPVNASLRAWPAKLARDLGPPVDRRGSGR